MILIRNLISPIQKLHDVIILSTYVNDICVYYTDNILN